MRPAIVNSLEGLTKEHLEPEQRTLINVCVSDKPVSYLYDTGSQYTIITRKTYGSLTNKHPLSPFNSSGIAVDGHTFCFDGIVYLNFSFDLKEGRTHQVEYEPVLVSKEITSNIFGAKAENKFKSCQRDFEKLFIEYKTYKNQTVFIKCYEENYLLAAAFIEIAKVSFVPVQRTKFKGKISQMFDKIPDKIYLIKDCLRNENILSCGDYKSDTLNKSIKIPVINLSENLMKLKKDQWLAEITIVECAENKPIEINSNR